MTPCARCAGLGSRSTDLTEFHQETSVELLFFGCTRSGRKWNRKRPSRNRRNPGRFTSCRCLGPSRSGYLCRLNAVKFGKRGTSRSRARHSRHGLGLTRLAFLQAAAAGSRDTRQAEQAAAACLARPARLARPPTARLSSIAFLLPLRPDLFFATTSATPLPSWATRIPPADALSAARRTFGQDADH